MNVLVASHNIQDVERIQQVLEELHLRAVVCQSGLDALPLMLDHALTAAIIDVDLRGMPALRLAALIKGMKESADIPIFIIGDARQASTIDTDSIDPDLLYHLNSPVSPIALRAKLKVHLDNDRLREQQKALITRITSTSESLSKRALQLNTLAQVNKHITSILDLQLLLPTVTSLVCSTFEYYFVGIWLVTGDSRYIILQAGHDHNGSQPFPAGFVIEIEQPKGILAHVSRTREAWLANDVAQDMYFWQTEELPATQSEITLPLMVGSSFLGVIDIHSAKINGFDSVDQVLCQALADSTATAIRNAQWYEELEKRVRNRTAELERVVYQLESLDRDKTNFIQVVSHELLTPLTLILGFSQVLQADDCPDDIQTFRQHANGIYSGAQRMQDIIQNMLDIVQLDFESIHLDLEPVMLQALLSRVINEYEPAIKDRRLQLNYNLSHLPRIDGDTEVLYKLFSQLISNAVKYTPDLGTIAITGEVIEQDRSYVEIVIRDTGIGIEPQSLDLIFSKFYRIGSVDHHSSSKTRFKGGGAGLGLSIARGIVQAHHGRIWAESDGCDETLYPGSSFHVLLPIKQAAN